MAVENQGVTSNGYYWYFEGDTDTSPEIVEVRGMEVYVCGKEGFYFLMASGEDEYTLSGRFVGPVLPPANAG